MKLNKFVLFLIGAAMGGSLALLINTASANQTLEVGPKSVVKSRHTKMLTKIKKYSKHPNPKHGAIIMLIDPRDGFFCSAVVFDESYAATAAHCLFDMMNQLSQSDIIIADENGVPTGKLARAVGASGRLDFGLLRGDFSEHARYPLATHVNGFYKSGPFVACGFPQGQKGVVCHPYVPMSQLNFFTAGKGPLVPGMSGGPVINTQTGEVVGVNSAVENEFSLVTPLTGFLGAFGID